MEYKDIDSLREVANRAKLQLSETSNALQRVIPVMEVDKKICNIVRTLTRTTSGTGTLYTTPADKDFYLTSMNYGLIKDAACDMANGDSGPRLTIDGTSSSISPISIPMITLTAQNANVPLTFSPPIKIDRNTIISISGGVNTYTAGVCIRSLSITGYTVEPN